MKLACMVGIALMAGISSGETGFTPGVQIPGIQGKPPVTGKTYGRILAIGDSITVGQGFLGGWRQMVQEALTTEGIGYTFVGRSDPRSPMSQPFHEGHSGWTTSDLLEGRVSEMAGNIKAWVRRYRPETVILMAGTNDKTASAASQVQMIADILNVNPAIKVIVGTIPPSKKSGPRLDVESQNRAGQIMAVEAFRRTGYNVVLAPISEGFDPATMLVDEVHPNQLGYQHMAGVFRQTLRSLYGF